MLLRVIFFLVIGITIFCMILNVKQNENFISNTTSSTINNVNNDKLYFNGSVHLKGKLEIENSPNKIKVDTLCFRKKENGVIKEECIDGDTLSYVINNTDDRNYLKCLDDICISNDHLNILKNETNFKLKNQDKCYMRRDALFHGLGGNYNSLTDTENLNSMEENNIDGIQRLRRGWYKKDDRKPGDWHDKRFRENMPGTLHDDGGQYFVYTDGGWRNQPFIPNFVVGENCDEVFDPIFAGYINTQKKNHFRFIRTEFEGPQDETVETTTQAISIPNMDRSDEFIANSSSGFRTED